MSESFVIELSGRVAARCRSVTARRGAVVAGDGWGNLRCESVVVTAGFVPAGSAADVAAAGSAESLLKKVPVDTMQ